MPALEAERRVRAGLVDAFVESGRRGFVGIAHRVEPLHEELEALGPVGPGTSGVAHTRLGVVDPGRRGLLLAGHEGAQLVVAPGETADLPLVGRQPVPGRPVVPDGEVPPTAGPGYRGSGPMDG